MIIQPVNQAGSHCQGRLHRLTVDQITQTLGFQPNVEDDPYKVENSWGFTVDGVHCGIWDWKGSQYEGVFSYSGPTSLLAKVFGSDKIQPDYLKEALDKLTKIS